MDGLAVTVVPRERAGMATGIFSTVRVAGEGIALAVVGAALAALLARELTAIWPSMQHGSAVAQVLVTGNMQGALALMPGPDPNPRAGLIRCKAAGATVSWSTTASPRGGSRLKTASTSVRGLGPASASTGLTMSHKPAARLAARYAATATRWRPAPWRRWGTSVGSVTATVSQNHK